MMRRILLLVTAALVMAAMMVVMAMPAFAAKPNRFTVACQNEEGNFRGQVYDPERPPGRDFGRFNRTAAEIGFHGHECERTIETITI
jgi:hypothetical protein